MTGARDARVIDAARLPEAALDTRSPVWWGIVWLAVILTTFIALMAASYFYVMRNFEQWPPPQVNRAPPVLRPLPGLFYSTANVLLMVASVVPVRLADRAARRMRGRPLRVNLTAAAAAALLTLTLRLFEFTELGVLWNDNAYGSVVWGNLVLHLACLYGGTAAIVLMAAWTWTHEPDAKHALDVTITSLFWYWVVGIWLPVYVIVYWSPRFL